MILSESTVQLTRASHWAEEGRSVRSLARAAESGERIRIRRGIYVDRSDWAAATEAERHRARMHAAVAAHSRHPVVFSHDSAAVIWGIPQIGRRAQDVHALTGERRRPHPNDGVVWHQDAVDNSDVCERDGFLVTTLLRTLVDLARSTGFVSAVASLDYGTKEVLTLPSGGRIAGIPRGVLLDRLEREGPARGVRSARAALLFSDPLSGSPGESRSRVGMHRLRFPRPRLQVPVRRPDGSGVDIPDFDWEEALGEFDGKMKYTRDVYTGGRPIEEIVWDEKRREDRLRRSTRKAMARWLWDDAVDPRRLARILMDAGLTPMSEARYRRESGFTPR
jgi:hypothetical protein